MTKFNAQLVLAKVQLLARESASGKKAGLICTYPSNQRIAAIVGHNMNIVLIGSTFRCEINTRLLFVLINGFSYFRTTESGLKEI